MDLFKQLKPLAEQVEIVELSRESTLVEFEANKLKSSKVEETRGVAVRAVRNGQAGLCRLQRPGEPGPAGGDRPRIGLLRRRGAHPLPASFARPGRQDLRPADRRVPNPAPGADRLRNPRPGAHDRAGRPRQHPAPSAASTTPPSATMPAPRRSARARRCRSGWRSTASRATTCSSFSSPSGPPPGTTTTWPLLAAWSTSSLRRAP